MPGLSATAAATVTDKLAGEETIIQEFLAPLAAGAPGAFGLRDDCAVAAPPPGHEFVLKTDAVAEGVHFLADDRPEDIAWKALAVNVSDLAAKAAVPYGYLLSLAFPEAPARAWMQGFAAGLAEAQAAFGMHLLGGDTDRRPGPVSITPMVLGTVPQGRMIRRGAARGGEIVFVSGTLGDAGLGLRLRRDPALAARWGLSDEAASALLRRFLRPAPRLALREALRNHASAAMDLSDGLLKDLGRMCRASGCGAVIEHAMLPVSPAFARVRGRDPSAASAALLAGDDYEVLATVPAGTAAAFETMASAVGVAVARIGVMRERADIEILDANQQPMPLADTGYDHF